MPQFQIRKHPHGGTFQTFFLNSGKPTKSWYEGNSIGECLANIELYCYKNVGQRFKFWLEVLPD